MGWEMFKIPILQRNQGGSDAVVIFIAPEVVFVFRCPGVLGPQDVSRIVLDLCEWHIVVTQ